MLGQGTLNPSVLRRKGQSHSNLLKSSKWRVRLVIHLNHKETMYSSQPGSYAGLIAA
jgi:hypothetical protein